MKFRNIYRYPYYFLRRVGLAVSFLYDRLRLHSHVAKYQEKNPNGIWLFSERPEEAGDNAIALFSYVRKNYPEIAAFYVIKGKEKFRDEMSSAVYAHMVEYNSDDHKTLFLASNILISTHCRGDIEPWTHKILNIVYRDYKKKKFVFLQHGVLKDDLSEKLSRENNQFDIFICGAKPEYDDVLKNYGYTEKEVKYTGLARYDKLYNIDVKRQIVLMPTWREYIMWQAPRGSKEATKLFLDSQYYKSYQSLINSPQLHNILKDAQINLIFYPHFEAQPYLTHFTTSSSHIILAKKDTYNVGSLLKESALLITDYSSIFFDFAYMKKPLLYYQFDEDDFYGKHYKKGYFGYNRDGFGDVCTQEDDLIKRISHVINTDCKMEEKYKERAKRFFPLHDQKNCERIYNEVIKL